ncbi:MAG: zinc ribbon domain-containing protein [Dehalococcoidia bacterium]|nr:zinc ribbon domain-containing protein [Dehalococcoidia bacterium]
MAIYEFVCPKCSNQFEVMRPMSASSRPAKCPKCASAAKRQVSSFGSKVGFYVKAPEKPPFRKAPEKASTPAKAKPKHKSKPSKK